MSANDCRWVNDWGTLQMRGGAVQPQRLLRPRPASSPSSGSSSNSSSRSSSSSIRRACSLGSLGANQGRRGARRGSDGHQVSHACKSRVALIRHQRARQLLQQKGKPATEAHTRLVPNFMQTACQGPTQASAPGTRPWQRANQALFPLGIRSLWLTVLFGGGRRVSVLVPSIGNRAGNKRIPSTHTHTHITIAPPGKVLGCGEGYCVSFHRIWTALPCLVQTFPEVVFGQPARAT
ncbi:hypothetical protein LY76DRAFT_227759 [Colletotrichum caudatum]|nr:hypothetical protein LY76DRAFT_227759 [Colletotrichum caudatum]